MNREITLITGGAGFIGSHLCEHFVHKGHFVISIDNLITGQVDNLKSLKNNDNFVSFTNIDVCEMIYPQIFASAIGLGRLAINNVLHFASPASPIDFPKIPIEILRVNGIGTYNMLELARFHNARFIFASTSEVYGDPKEHPQKETYLGNVNCVGVRGAYDEAKRYGEALTTAYLRKYNLNTKIIRIFNTYGPRMPYDGRVLTAFVNQIMSKKHLTIFGSGEQTRSFCYITDMIDAIDKLLYSDINDPINIGNPNEITINTFAKKLLDLTKVPGIGMQYLEAQKDDPKQRRPDITKAKDLLKWEPKISIDEGLKKYLDYRGFVKPEPPELIN